MIRSFKDRDTRLLFERLPGRRWRSVETVARRKLEILDAATLLEELRLPPGNRLEALKGDRRGQYSIRVNQQWRLCFVWREGDAYDVEITDYH